jgi:hypothetical protein
MSDDDRVDATTVMAEGIGAEYAAYVPVSAIIIVEAIDPETGNRHLLHRRSTEGPWSQVGMLFTVADGIRKALQADDDD